PPPVVEEIDRTVILATQLINAAALHDRLGKAWAVPEASTCSLRAAVTDSAESLRGLLEPPAGGPHDVRAGGFLTPILPEANLDVQNRHRAPRRPHRPHRPAQRASACRSNVASLTNAGVKQQVLPRRMNPGERHRGRDD